MVSPAQPSQDASRAPRPTPRLIAFYQPQFHTIPENDAFWGTGFTDWASVVRARPLFPDHYQPRIPADLGFYDLRLPEVRQAQADLAREHSIHGFCYYHYWFKGRRVLERPFDEVLGSGHPDFPFSLCWANQDWTWRRDTSGQGRLITQEYSEEDDIEHIRWLLDVFRDDRYIKIDGRPLFLIHAAHAMPFPKRTFALWREEARKAGVAEPYICKVDSFGNVDPPGELGYDAAVEFWPHAVDKLLNVKRIRGEEEVYSNNAVYDYRELVTKYFRRTVPPFRRFPCVVPCWDDTARAGSTGASILHGSTPELYERWLRGVIEEVSSNPPQEQLVFVNAWNDWGKGAYLEPDYEYGRAYLEATGRALRALGVELPADSDGAGCKAGEDMPAPRSIEESHRDLLDKYRRLQESLMEHLNTEELSPLVQRANQRVRELKRDNRQLEKDYKQLELQYQRLETRSEKLKEQRARLQAELRKVSGRDLTA